MAGAKRASRAFAAWLALFAPAMWGLALASSVGVAAGDTRLCAR
jgi:hypothetical protein